MDADSGLMREVPAPYVPLNNAGVWAALATLCAVTIGSVTWAFWNPYAEFLMFGMMASAIVTAPMLRRDYDLVSPWSMLALTVFIGCGLRGATIAAEGPDDILVDYLFLRGKDVDFFFIPSLAFLVALALMAATYSWRVKKATPRNRPTYQFGAHTEFVATVCAVIGLVAFFLYMQRTGGYITGVFSAKRTTIPGLELTGYEGAHGDLRAMNQLSAFGFWIMVAKYAHSGVAYRFFSTRGLFVAGLFVNAALLPSYSSSRAEVAYILVVALVIQLCLSKHRRSGRRLVKAGVVTLALLSVLTFWRATSGEPLTSQAAWDSVSSTLVFNRSFAEIPKRHTSWTPSPMICHTVTGRR